MKRMFWRFLVLCMLVLVPVTSAQASRHHEGRYRHSYHYDGYQGRDRDGGWSYQDRDDGYRDGGYRYHGDDRYYDDDGEGDGYSYHRGNGDPGDCQSGGCGNRSRRCDRSSGDCRSSFSPGPFKDSPITVCAPYSCNSGGQQSGSNGDGGRDGKQPPKEPAPKDETDNSQ